VRKTLLLILASALVAGCGESGGSAADFEGEQKRVAEVVEDLQDAGTNDEPRRICEEILARALRGNDCPRRVDEALKDADTYDLEVKSVRVTGTTARASVESGRDGDQVETVQLVREGRDWRISQLAGR
jgi:hypothetical protein